jgi:hypothetical protein
VVLAALLQRPERLSSGVLRELIFQVVLVVVGEMQARPEAISQGIRSSAWFQRLVVVLREPAAILDLAL